LEKRLLLDQGEEIGARIKRMRRILRNKKVVVLRVHRLHPFDPRTYLPCWLKCPDIRPHTHERSGIPMNQRAPAELQLLCDYLETTQAQLLASVPVNQLNQVPPDGGWSPGQVLAHLIRTEQYLYPVFAWLPKLAGLPWLVRALDWLNVSLCKLAGMGFISQGDQTDKVRGGLQQLTPQFQGRFLAPAFLKPGRQQYDWQGLQAARTRTRARTLTAVRRARLWQLQTVQFSHPEFGRLPLLEFVLFLGKHEEWHTAQLKRIAQKIEAPERATPHAT
jgi:hypothetical protein